MQCIVYIYRMWNPSNSVHVYLHLSACKHSDWGIERLENHTNTAETLLYDSPCLDALMQSQNFLDKKKNLNLCEQTNSQIKIYKFPCCVTKFDSTGWAKAAAGAVALWQTNTGHAHSNLWPLCKLTAGVNQRVIHSVWMCVWKQRGSTHPTNICLKLNSVQRASGKEPTSVFVTLIPPDMIIIIIKEIWLT